MDRDIARFMIDAAKFEFFVVNLDLRFAHIDPVTNAVTGVNWELLGQAMEEIFPFDEFDFSNSDFEIFRLTVPQKLVVSELGGLKWDSEEVEVSSWRVLLGRSYAQLRNNVAHGNKAQLPAYFTRERTAEFLIAGRNLIDFIAEALSGDKSWKGPIHFR
ncbi:hypothetical protein ACVDG9_23795 [Roseibium sp. RP-7]